MTDGSDSAEPPGKMVQAQGDPMALPGLEAKVLELANYCPYTLLATKTVQAVRGDEAPRPAYRRTREQEYRANIKLGLGIMLVGLFCPIFWGSYLVGMRGDELMWSAIHSGLVALVGLLLAAWYRVQLGRFGRSRRAAEE